jgi:hypothetical protein
MFKRLCQEANLILRRKYLPKSTNDQIATDETNCEGAVEERVTDDSMEETTTVEKYGETLIPARHASLRKRKVVHKSIKPNKKRPKSAPDKKKLKNFDELPNNPIASEQMEVEGNCAGADIPSCSNQMAKSSTRETCE